MAKQATGAAKLQLCVRTPAGIAVETAVDSVALPGLEGDFTARHEHHDTVAQLRHGIGEYDADRTKEYLSIFGGVATVRGNRVEVLSPVCELGRDLDRQRAEAAHRRAEERLAERQEGLDIARAQAALERALLRLEVAKLVRHK